MAVGEDPLDRAIDAARTDGHSPDQAGWPELAESTRERVRRIVRPGEPVEAVHDRAGGADDGSRTFVSTRVIVPALRAGIEGPDVAVDRVRLDVEDTVLRSVRIDVVARWDEHLPSLGDRVIAIAGEVLTELLGPRAVPVTVHVVDLTVEDPRA